MTVLFKEVFRKIFHTRHTLICQRHTMAHHKLRLMKGSYETTYDQKYVSTKIPLNHKNTVI
jgi:hypothetical protein